MLEYKYQRHADSENGNVGRLVEEVGDIGGLKELASGPDLEDEHDEHESDIHHVALDVVLQKLANLSENRFFLIFHCFFPLAQIYGHSHDLFLSRFFRAELAGYITLAHNVKAV